MELLKFIYIRMVNSPNTPSKCTKLKSPIYEFYDVDDLEKRIFKCKSCKQDYKSMTTSNLKTHIGEHPEAHITYMKAADSAGLISSKKRKLFGQEAKDVNVASSNLDSFITHQPNFNKDSNIY